MKNKFTRGVLATRNIVDLHHDVWAMPAPVVASLIG